ncbi:MAG TPA: hypothetical protein VIV08_00750, partial [Acidimicrobiia bacterium]
MLETALYTPGAGRARAPAEEMVAMIVFHDPAHRLHDPVEPHIFGGRSLPPAEVAARADRILEGLGSLQGLEVRRPGPVDRRSLARVHTERYLRFLETAHARWRSATGAGPDAE